MKYLIISFFVFIFLNACSSRVIYFNENEKCLYKETKGKMFLKNIDKENQIVNLDFYPDKYPFDKTKIKKTLKDIEATSGYNIQTDTDLETYKFIPIILKESINGCEEYLVELY
jgi:hypothetical protein